MLFSGANKELDEFRLALEFLALAGSVVVALSGEAGDSVVAEIDFRVMTVNAGIPNPHPIFEIYEHARRAQRSSQTPSGKHTFV
jgi:hypothetical protein